MSTFERDYYIEPEREKDAIRELPSIELSDEVYLAKMNLFKKMIDMSQHNAKSKSEIPQKKPRKNNRKSNKTAVESIQKEL